MPSVTKAQLLAEVDTLRKALERETAERQRETATRGQLDAELRARKSDLSEALEQQAAINDILRVISRSPTNLQPVLDTVAESAARLCKSFDCDILRLDGDRLVLVAHHGPIPGGTVGEFTVPLVRGTVGGRTVLEGRTIHVVDVQAEADEFPEAVPNARKFGFRTILSAPLIREGAPLGVIQLRRAEVSPFTERQVALLQTFADQAVITIENARLFTELREKNSALTVAHAQVTEALEQQTATSEILRVIGSSPTDVQPVFDAIAAAATTLCEADHAGLFRFDGDLIRFVAHHGRTPEEISAAQRAFPQPPRQHSVTGRAILAAAVVQIADVSKDPELEDALRIFRTVLSVPLMRDGRPLGAITVARRVVRSFTDEQIALLKTFADQAVIAIENVRLFKELEARNRDLTEALDQQTATSEILRVISSSPTDVRPVFNTIAQNARRLCGVDSAGVLTYDGELIQIESLDNANPERAAAIRQAYPMPANRGHATGRAILTGRPVHIPDVREDLDYAVDAVRDVGLRGVLAVPMVRDGIPIGAIVVQRWVTPRPFSDKQVELMKTFADQAVIAIENVRLFEALQEKNRALTQAHVQVTEALEQQTATSEILRVISHSPTDVQPVLDAVAESAARLCDAVDAIVMRVDGDMMHRVAHFGAITSVSDRRPVTRHTPSSRAILERRTIHIDDILAEFAGGEYLETRALQEGSGFRTVLAVPLMREDAVIGVITIRRLEVRPFTAKQMALVKTFADQAVIAIENVRLFRELEARNSDLTEALARQTATSEVLRAISRSPTDLQPVFDAIAENAWRLLRGWGALVVRFDGQLLHMAAFSGGGGRSTEETLRERFPAPANRETFNGAVILDRDVQQIADIETDEKWAYLRAHANSQGWRANLGVPLLHDGEPIGAISVTRSDPGAYSLKKLSFFRPSPTRPSSPSRTCGCSKSWRRRIAT